MEMFEGLEVDSIEICSAVRGDMLWDGVEGRWVGAANLIYF
jgi:hypothetical protein